MPLLYSGEVFTVAHHFKRYLRATRGQGGTRVDEVRFGCALPPPVRSPNLPRLLAAGLLHAARLRRASSGEAEPVLGENSVTELKHVRNAW